jgi:hypothetical protein
LFQERFDFGGFLKPGKKRRDGVALLAGRIIVASISDEQWHKALIYSKPIQLTC